MDYVEIVSELNNKLFEEDESITQVFTYSTDGYTHVIKCGDVVLWNSDNDEREFFEDKNEYEDLKMYIISVFNEYVSELLNISIIISH